MSNSKPKTTPMHAGAIGNFLFAARRSSDGIWMSRGKLMRWIHLTIRKDAVNLRIGKWMLGIMWEKNNAGI